MSGTEVNEQAEASTLQRFIKSVEEAGIKLWLEDGKLKYKGPKGPVTQKFVEALKIRRDEVVEYLELSEPTRFEIPYFSYHASKEEFISIPPNMKTLWECIKGGGLGIRYANSTRIFFRSETLVPYELAISCVQQLIEKYQILAARIIERDTEEGFLCDLTPDDILHETDISDKRNVDSDYELEQLITQLVWIPFQPDKSLVRIHLIHLPDGSSAILFLIHHFIVDDLSVGILQDAFLEILSHRLQNLPHALSVNDAVQFTSYLKAMNEWLPRLDVFKTDRAFWARTLDAAPPTHIRHDQTVLPDEVGDMVGRRFWVKREQLLQFEATCHKLGSSLFVGLLSVLQLALSEMVGREDIVLNILTDGRYQEAFSRAVGLFTNIVPLRVVHRSSDSFTEVLKVTQARLGDSMPRWRCPQYAFYHDVATAGSGWDAPIINFRTAQDWHDEQLTDEMIAARLDPSKALGGDAPVPWRSSARVYGNMHIMLRHERSGLWGQIQYLALLHDSAVIERFLGLVLEGIDRCARRPGDPFP